MTDKAALVTLANQQSNAPGQPMLTVDSTRETLISWLGWNDRNGCYTDADCDAEGMDRLTVETAWECVADALAA